MVVRPGVVYGGGDGIVGDLFKAASNGLVRVVGDGNNHWPLVYDRDLADLYVAPGGAARTPPASITPTTRATSASTTSSAAITPHVARPARRAARADRRSARQDGQLRRRAVARSGRRAARAPARSAGRRRCARSAATPRGCSKSGAARNCAAVRQTRVSRSSSSAPGSRSKNASRLRSSARRSCGIVPSIVCSVTLRGRAVRQRDLRVVQSLERAFRDEADAVDQGVTSHPAILAGLETE